MPRDLTSPVRPLYALVTMPSLYLCRPGTSTPSKLVFSPKAAPSRASSATSAACSRVFVGTQPRCRQGPPSLSFSTRSTVVSVIECKLLGLWWQLTPATRDDHAGAGAASILASPSAGRAAGAA